jgi:hypothetical protein
MAAWDEWERLKDEAARRASEDHAMRLNQLPADQGAGAGGDDLRAHQGDLGAVGHEAFLLHDDLRTVGDLAGAGAGADGEGSTWRAAAALTSRELTTGRALMTTLEIWTSQVRTVLQATAHISNHLDHSKKIHAQDDAEIGAVLRQRDGSAVSVSELDKYFT